MPSPRILRDNEGKTHFITMRVIEWMDVFTKPEYFNVLIESLEFCRAKKGLLLHGYVIMTNHIHFIATATFTNLSSILRDFKRHTSKEICKLLRDDNRNYLRWMLKNSYSKEKKGSAQIWHHNNWPILIEDENVFEQKLNYIHDNPVVKEYVAQTAEWLYSSARNYYLGDNSVIKIDYVD